MSGRAPTRGFERYAFSRVADYCERRRTAEHLATTSVGLVGEMCRHRVHKRTVAHWGERGWLTEEQADRVAVALGVMPYVIWPAWLEVGVRMADDYDAARHQHYLDYHRKWRARNLKKVRSSALAYRHRNLDAIRNANREAQARKLAEETPERRAARLAYQAQWRAENSERHRAGARDWYARNAESEREKQRQRRAARREVA